MKLWILLTLTLTLPVGGIPALDRDVERLAIDSANLACVGQRCRPNRHPVEVICLNNNYKTKKPPKWDCHADLPTARSEPTLFFNLVNVTCNSFADVSRLSINSDCVVYYSIGHKAPQAYIGLFCIVVLVVFFLFMSFCPTRAIPTPGGPQGNHKIARGIPVTETWNASRSPAGRTRIPPGLVHRRAQTYPIDIPIN
eukprot:TRINITY_DN21922_c0_g1_i1.p1 TRINITY_DN21922_c0_g1~~TRINITY_DN21922_c0_g1_i1.p1  ORF type:complete len:197 (-),score=11.41 TRINITY_DN21922_c0_g1_i1:29-619(-)